MLWMILINSKDVVSESSLILIHLVKKEINHILNFHVFNFHIFTFALREHCTWEYIEELGEHAF